MARAREKSSRSASPHRTSGGRGRPKRPSREQVKAWLATVIAPILKSLQVEELFTGRRNWTFRAATVDFELLAPIRSMPAEPFLPNLDQFFRHYPGSSRKAAQHDAALDRLRDACRAALDELASLDMFVFLAAHTTTRPEEQRVLAEYVINGVRDLPYHSPYRESWATQGRDFLAFRESPDMLPHIERMNQSGTELHRVVQSLLQDFEQHQHGLADEFQLPPVDPIGTATV